MNRPVKRPLTVTDRGLPSVSVATQLPRPLYEELEQRAHAEGLTKSAYVRKLIIDALEGAIE